MYFIRYLIRAEAAKAQRLVFKIFQTAPEEGDIIPLRSPSLALLQSSLSLSLSISEELTGPYKRGLYTDYIGALGQGIGLPADGHPGPLG
jgi:hypothetical protein